MTARPTSGHPLPFNGELASRLHRTVGVDLAGSIYAVPAPDRAAVAGLLAEQKLWVHADVFSNSDQGVSPGLIVELADSGAARIDVHLLSRGALDALDTVCRPGVARVTVPFENVDDIAGIAQRVRAAGAQPWLAVAPGTALEECVDAARHVDGLLVMLLEPGTRSRPDLKLLSKVADARGQYPVGVDGGVGEANLAKVLAAGASYVVIGRRLFTVPSEGRSGSVPAPSPHTIVAYPEEQT
jgi:pentose-5-phosphate-3-epimerase